ncbi:MAG: M50 family metallopeptidase [Dokdonella sp.]
MSSEEAALTGPLESSGSRAIRHLVGAVWLVTSVGCIFFIAEGVRHDRLVSTARAGHPFEFSWVIAQASLTFIALTALSVILHECGHLVAAHRMRMTLLSMRVWPVEWVRRRRGVRLQRAISAKPIACVIAMPNPQGAVNRQCAWFAAGGPAANALIAVLAGAYWLCNVILDFSTGGMTTLIVVLGVLNTYLAIVNLLPIGRTVPSDGTQIRCALRGLSAKQWEPDYLQYMDSCFFQASPVEISHSTVARWLRSSQPALRATGFHIRFQSALTDGDMPAIVVAYTRLVEGVRALGPQGPAACGMWLAVSTLEFVYEICVRGGDMADATRRVDALGRMRHLAPRSLLMRVEAAFALRRGDRKRALPLLERARREAGNDFAVSSRAYGLSKIEGLAHLVGRPSA